MHITSDCMIMVVCQEISPSNRTSWFDHYSHVIMTAMASKITDISIVFSAVAFVQAKIKENIKAPYHWLLCDGNSPVTPHTKGH